MSSRVFEGGFLAGLIIGALVTSAVRDTNVEDTRSVVEPDPELLNASIPPTLNPPSASPGLPNVSMSPADMFCAQQGVPLVRFLPSAATGAAAYTAFNQTHTPSEAPVQLLTRIPVDEIAANPYMYGNIVQEHVSIPLNCATYYTDVVCPNNDIHEWTVCMAYLYESWSCDAWLDSVLPNPSHGLYYFMAIGEDQNETAVTYSTRCVPDSQRKRIVAADTTLLDTCDDVTRDVLMNGYGWSWFYSHSVDLTGASEDPAFFEAPCNYTKNFLGLR